MALYFAEYDLVKQRDYESLYDALRKLGASRYLLSAWAFRRDGTTCESMRDYLRQFMDADDRLMVSEVTNWSSWNALVDVNKV